jgi:hypothetical protein
MSSAFPYSEAKISERIGVSRTDLKAIRDRKLKEGSDWKKVAGEVALSGPGIKRLWQLLETRPAGFELESCLIVARAKKNGAAGNGNGHGTNGDAVILLTHASVPVEMVVTRKCLNTAIVLAQQTTGFDRRTQTVWVGKNFNYTPGMNIQVRRKKNVAGVWEMAGPVPMRSYPAQQWNRMQAPKPETKKSRS